MGAFDSTRTMLDAGGRKVAVYSLDALAKALDRDLSRLPISVKVVLESLLRLQDHPAFTEAHVRHLAAWRPGLADEEREEIPYMPSRVLLQDFTGVPCVVDLAALRAALKRAGHAPARIEPSIPVDLVIDHSVQIDDYGHGGAFDVNLAREFERNTERYTFLRWGQQAFEKLTVLPPGLGICHQVNMEYLARCVSEDADSDGTPVAFPDTLVGTDSHTTMVNSMGVLGWGVGGIEAEAAMLGQPIPILTPQVVGMRLTGEVADGVTPTDIALAVTQVLRQKGVVGRFVEFFGPGVDGLTLSDRAPIANMAPEYGATMGFFPVDNATLTYLRETGRSEAQVTLVEAYCRAQGLFRDPEAEPVFDEVVELDLSDIRPSLAGPKRPQDRVTVPDLKQEFEAALPAAPGTHGFGVDPDAVGATADAGEFGTLGHGSVVIAAITSCTNTSNPQLMLGAALLARKAADRGLKVPRHVKTSFAPGSRVVTEYLKASGLLPSLEQLGFFVSAYGCTTCIGNSGPLADPVEKAIRDGKLVAAAVLSGNRNFEGRIHPLTQANYLASPLLVVAYALAGTVAIDLDTEPVGAGSDGQPVFLKELWPTRDEIRSLVADAVDPDLYRSLYGDQMAADRKWTELTAQDSPVFDWDPDSTYIREPTFFEDFAADPEPLADIHGARVLGKFGDFITTDHISPAGAIAKDSPAARYLREHGVADDAFNSYGSRRGNHEVMMRGTFANIRIKNQLVEGVGGYTVNHLTGEETSIYDAAMAYREAGVPLVVLAGKMYGAGSSRDWAAKGTFLLGVKAVLAESFERIHRSNLVEMGVLPLEYVDGQTADSLGLDGTETFTVGGIAEGLRPGARLPVTAARADGAEVRFEARCRIDTPIEVDYYRHGGILAYVLREAMGAARAAPA